MVPRKNDDGEMKVLRELCDGSTDSAQRSGIERALEAPVKVAGALPFPAAMRAELVRRGAALGLEQTAVEAWLRPLPERIDAGTDPWPAEFTGIFRTVKDDYESAESPNERAARIATTLEGALVTNDADFFTAYFRVPNKPADVHYPLLLLSNITWLMNVLDEQRRTLVAECRARDRSWADIALALGVTRASAWERYSSPDD